MCTHICSPTVQALSTVASLQLTSMPKLILLDAYPSAVSCKQLLHSTNAMRLFVSCLTIVDCTCSHTNIKHHADITFIYINTTYAAAVFISQWSQEMQHHQQGWELYATGLIADIPRRAMLMYRRHTCASLHLCPAASSTIQNPTIIAQCMLAPMFSR